MWVQTSGFPAVFWRTGRDIGDNNSVDRMELAVFRSVGRFDRSGQLNCGKTRRTSAMEDHPPPADPLDDHLDFPRIERFRDVLVSSLGAGTIGCPRITESSHDNDPHVRPLLLYSGQEFEPVDFGHPKVGNDNVESRLGQLAQRVSDATRRFHTVALADQDSAHHFAHQWFVVDDQHSCSGFHEQCPRDTTGLSHGECRSFLVVGFSEKSLIPLPRFIRAMNGERGASGGEAKRAGEALKHPVGAFVGTL
jgi:hypothetical protein